MKGVAPTGANAMTPARTFPKKPGRYLGMTAIAVGAVFLFDPFIGIFDFLPDAIGYLLITLGLYRLSDLDDRLAEAMRGAGRLALLGLARLLALLLTYGLVSPTERPVFTLLAVFTLAVLDLLVLIPLWRNFSGGLLYLGSRHDATTLFRLGGRRRARSATERYTTLTLVYMVIREVIVVLPELTVLTHTSGGAEWDGNSLYDYVGIFRLSGEALSLILGILWLIATFRFLRLVKSDEPFFERLRHRYETEVLTRRDVMAMRAIKAAMISLSAATVLFLDFYIEGVDVLPDFLGALLLALSLYFLRPYVQNQLLPVLATAAYGIASAILWGCQIGYFHMDEMIDIHHDPATYERWDAMCSLQTVTAALYVVTFVLILRMLYGLTRQHTGLRARHEGSTYAAERTEAIHTHIFRRLLLVGIFVCLTALSTLAHWVVVPQLPTLDFPGRPEAGDALTVMLYDGLREAYWFVDLLFGGALVGLSIHAGSEIFEQMDYSYLMND